MSGTFLSAMQATDNTTLGDLIRTDLGEEWPTGQ